MSYDNNLLNCAGFLMFTPDMKQIVLVKTPKGVYGFPKGKREYGEVNMLTTAYRELEEETGIKKEDFDELLVGQYIDESSRKSNNPCIRLYFGRLKKIQKLFPIDKNELDEAVYMNIDDALKVLMDKRKKVLSTAINMLKLSKASK
jgi:8-oxo-dGTP pyrophosphatase MutT (NUDIX family)